PIILRVNSKEFGELHTEIIKNKNYSSIIKIEKNKNNFFKNFYNYLILGYEHILPKGLDHILFVLALFLLSSNIKTLILQISLFTIAHTITLFLGVFNIIKISSYIVEPIIALSIAYVGIENLFKNNLSKSRTIIIFIFGLLHGLGFAGVLSDIGLVKELFVSSLISFNIGVELGQISTIVLAYLIIKLPFSKMDWYSTRITKPISLLISIIGIFWFFERIFF
ncbi:MAG: HupE/UreJ family protein, partial [Pelagibacteraceae bacterium]